MVQGYTQQDSGSKGGWSFNPSSRRVETGTSIYCNEAFLCSYPRGAANDQWAAYLPKGPKLPRAEATDRETGESMLSVSIFNHFYYLCNFTNMRCKHSRVLSIIREQLHREPSDRDMFIVMSRDRRIVRMFTYDNRSCTLFEKKFVATHQFLKVDHNDDERV